MEQNLMERADRLGGKPPPDNGRRIFTLSCALSIHALIFFCLSYAPQRPLTVPTAPIAVNLVILDPTAVPEEPPSISPPEPQPQPERKPEPEPEPELELDEKEEDSEKDLETLSEQNRPTTDITPEPSLTLPSPAQVEPQDTKDGQDIPNKWRLPPGTSIALDKTQQPSTQLQNLGKSLECLSFDADCAAQRKSVFAAEQLSETDLVWMASQAHSGLSNSDLFGLSEAEIREKLGIPTAGRNGFMILPGIGIDGPWWDALHGVNKACSYSVGVNESGQRELKKNCAKQRPSSKDRIRFIPKPFE